MYIDGNFIPQRAPDGDYKVIYDFYKYTSKTKVRELGLRVTATAIVNNANEILDF